MVSPTIHFIGGPLAYPFGQKEPEVEVLTLSDDEDGVETQAALNVDHPRFVYLSALNLILYQLLTRIFFKITCCLRFLSQWTCTISSLTSSQAYAISLEWECCSWPRHTEHTIINCPNGIIWKRKHIYAISFISIFCSV